MNYPMDSNLLNRQYSVLVAGDVDLAKYDLTKQVTPYIVYEYDKRADIRKQAITVYKELIKNVEKEENTELIHLLMKANLQEMEDMTDEEYFEYATKGMLYDKATGNALTTINPNGKYIKLNEPSISTAIPLVDNKFQCLVQDLPEKTENISLIEKYSEHWDKIMIGPEKQINDYKKTYRNKETYVKVMTEPLFYNAFVSQKTGWLEQVDGNQIEWVLNFRDKFIKSLPKDTLLKVYNFIR